jgi:hypothetical protein
MRSETGRLHQILTADPTRRNVHEENTPMTVNKAAVRILIPSIG